ncbi:MAG TPA: 2-oxoacid:acceptor oxidoreductase subunit alpha [Thermoanaerobaculia bacterium]|jgi:2-oxoglutarate ferredoxin oxidoreductase subunit alpha|nr:2-oxoacid:acceptor oxidoreductase subunit alpha [Thermoanaerobaculia bacterium]
MSTAVLEEKRSEPASRPPVINDFSIHVATANGSGSQSSNSILMRAIFQMGIPVSGKNLFPSNIQGLPTWFTIRASKEGFIARRRDVGVLICMNPETAHEDVKTVAPGAAVIYEESLKLDTLRSDVVFYPVPFQKLVLELVQDGKLRRLAINMIYVGVAAWLLGVDLAEIEKAVAKQFKSKAAAVEINMKAIRGGLEWAEKNLTKRDAFRLERMNATAGKIIIEGNAASAIGCMMAGVQFLAWYPITPSSSLAESLIDYAGKHRLDPETGKLTFAVVQAEDELAALGMVLGAGWAGARAMTTTSGPGISLMSEFTGLGYYAEVPAVIVDVQRVGPSTGLPTRTMQGDITSTYYLGHGDAKHILLLPGSVEECYSMSMDAFDLAERFQTPVFLMSDLDLGMNNWMADPFSYSDKPIDRGKVLKTKEELEAHVAKFREFARYRDVDGDGIPWRTLPGFIDSLAATYFTRGSGHNERALYTERPDDYKNNMDRLARKFETAKKFVPRPVVAHAPGARVAVIAYGSSDFAVEEARVILGRKGFQTGYLRLRALPFTPETAAFVAAHDRVYVVDQNRDGQMYDLLRLELGADALKLRSIRHYDGFPLDAETVIEGIEAGEKR